MRILRLVFDLLGLVCFLLLMAFVWRNREFHASIDLGFGWWEKVPVSMIALASGLAGSILALFFAIPEWVRLRARIRELRDGTGPKDE